MKKRHIIIISIILLITSSIIVCLNGRNATFDLDISNKENIKIDYDKNYINCKYNITDNNMNLYITAKKNGKTNIKVTGKNITSNNNEEILDINLYNHRTGIITYGSFFGYCNGDLSFIISFYIILTLIIIYMIKSYLINIKKNMYSYKNARNLGLIIFLTIPSIINIFFFFYDLLYNHHKSIEILIGEMRENIVVFIVLAFPLAFILTILVTISNIVLIIKEGKTWKNMLGIILGGFICITTLLNIIFGVIYSEKIVLEILSYILMMCVIYLECVFFGVCISGIVSAKYIPKFDKDAIIILGCKIRSDGTLPPLLQGRVDRAIEFSKMQKETTGKDIIFIPSGGKGKDEIISEAQAMKNYLLQQGIKKNKILLEDKSTSTYENLKFSSKLIKEQIEKPILAFSTTNYHVFRAGVIAKKQRLNIEGIGSKTKSYYWINAFIREFIGTLSSERKENIKTLIILSIIIIILSLIRFI